MKKLHSLAFYALVAPAIALGSAALLAAQDTSEERDVGEQSMGADADSKKTQSSEQDNEATKSKYNDKGAAGQGEKTDQKKRDQSDKQNED